MSLQDNDLRSLFRLIFDKIVCGKRILESNGLVEFVDENIDLVRLEDAKQRYPDFGFHDECYQKFTNISIINKVQILTYFTMHQNVLKIQAKYNKIYNKFSFEKT